jgi:23S rRNA (pseudouridine1915-N3)-methyltransferase
MKIQIWSVGRQHEPYIKTGVDEFTRRIGKYFPVEWAILPPPRNAGLLSEIEMKEKEAAIILQRLKKDDFLVTLDEGGKPLNSIGLADFIRARANEGNRNLVFLIGGAYGLDAQILKKAGFSWSLSSLTFPHQLVRLILCEQLYRACTIIRNEKYHHA